VSASTVKAHSLHALGALKQTLRQTRREADEAAARHREQAARAARERNLFALTVGTVVPLRVGSAAHLIATPRPPAEPRQSQRDEAAVMGQALSDEFDVESLLETDDSLSFRRRGIGPEVVRKLRRGVWAVQAQLDLHGLRRDEARERLSAFLHDARRDGLRCLRVIHGKGNGSPGREPVLKAKVRSWLVQRDAVIAFAQARAAEGGAGALIVLLASARPARTQR
jgi:DNA-nicking Smr family endonuclease